MTSSPAPTTVVVTEQSLTVALWGLDCDPPDAQRMAAELMRRLTGTIEVPMTSSPAPDLDEPTVDVRASLALMHCRVGACEISGNHYVYPNPPRILQAIRDAGLELVDPRAARSAAAGSRPMLARAARKYLAVVNERYHGRATWGDVADADADLREILDADP